MVCLREAFAMTSLGAPVLGCGSREEAPATLGVPWAETQRLPVPVHFNQPSSCSSQARCRGVIAFN